MQMDRLHTGDMVHVGGDVFEPVINWLHQEPDKTLACVHLHTEDGNILRLSPKHVLFKSDHSTCFASDIGLGDALLGGNGTAVRVVRVKAGQTGDGVFAPLTQSGQVVVDGVVCSCFAHVYHWPALILIRAAHAWLASVQRRNGCKDVASLLLQSQRCNVSDDGDLMLGMASVIARWVTGEQPGDNAGLHFNGLAPKPLHVSNAVS
jgi:hypothetical protein